MSERFAGGGVGGDINLNKNGTHIISLQLATASVSFNLMSERMKQVSFCKKSVNIMPK